MLKQNMSTIDCSVGTPINMKAGVSFFATSVLMAGTSLWCGLVAGMLEVGLIVLRKTVIDSNGFLNMPRDFLWSIPLTTVSLFLVVGFVLALLDRVWPSSGRICSIWVLCTLSVLSPLLVALPRIHPMALLIVAAGLARQLTRLLAPREQQLRVLMKFGLPILVVAFLSIPSTSLLVQFLKDWRENSRQLPKPGTPNVLLIVLDTVRADHLSLYGYDRPTTPNLNRLSERAIRFADARSTSPWSLPSHASLFTGRWADELRTDWITPLDNTYPTLAEYLGQNGFATAGFVANTWLCAYDSGLARGFTHYEDYMPEVCQSIHCSSLVKQFLGLVSWIDRAVTRCSLIWRIQWVTSRILRTFGEIRKHANTINEQFLSWLSSRKDPTRPFYAFLNYTDAHHPYTLPRRAIHRFGGKPSNASQTDMLEGWWNYDKSKLSASDLSFVVDAYDSCISYLDKELGELLDGLATRGLLDETLVIITADHGEEFGEHGLFGHSISLYHPEIHVPILIVTPWNRHEAIVVSQTVSLRNIPATIVDLLELRSDSPFPGSSLAPYWNGTATKTSAFRGDLVLSEALSPQPIHNFIDPNQNRSPIYRGRIVSIADDDYIYIANEGDGREELYDSHRDPGELNDLSREATFQSTLARLRDLLKVHVGGRREEVRSGRQLPPSFLSDR